MGHPRRAPVGEYTPLHITATGTTVAVGELVDTTGTTSITAGSNVTITPASIVNILPGMWLNIANGVGTPENVQVTSVNVVAGTFVVASLANNHSGSYTIISLKGSFVGALVVNAVGTGITITLYNGHPSTLPVAGTPFAVITPVAGNSYPYNCWCSHGLFYTVAGTTAGDYTLTYLDSQV